MKLPIVPSEGFLQALPPAERKRLKQLTRAEAQAKYLAGQERKLQDDIFSWLSLREIYFESDRMDKPTRGKRGRADFRICVHGLWLSAEAKTASGKLSDEQREQALALINSGGRFVVVRSLKALIKHLQRLMAIADGLDQDHFDYRKELEN
jgi:hypothetical protein